MLQDKAEELLGGEELLWGEVLLCGEVVETDSEREMDADMEVFEVGDFCICSLRGRMTLGLGGYRPGQS